MVIRYPRVDEVFSVLTSAKVVRISVPKLTHNDSRVGLFKAGQVPEVRVLTIFIAGPPEVSE